MTALLAHLPAPKEIRDLLTDLLDKEVELRPAPPFGVGPATPASVATYVDDSLVVHAVVALDLPLSAYVGASLALVPSSEAHAQVDAGHLGGAVAESLREVFNILASTFNAPGASHLRLYSAQVSGEPLPPDVRARTQLLGRRCDFHATVTGYGSGRLAIVLV